MQTEQSNSAPTAFGAGPTANHRFEADETGEDLILRDPVSGAVHTLNDSAAAVWWLSDGSRSRDQIMAEIARIYQADIEEVAEDVDQVISELVKIDALRQR